MMMRDTARTEGSPHIGIQERELYVLPPMVAADPPSHTLLNQLNQDQIPSRPKKLDEDPRSGNVLYEVMP